MQINVESNISPDWKYQIKNHMWKCHFPNGDHFTLRPLWHNFLLSLKYLCPTYAITQSFPYDIGRVQKVMLMVWRFNTFMAFNKHKVYQIKAQSHLK